VDFYDLPPVRRAATDVMHKWLKDVWCSDSIDAKKKLEDLASFSKSLSDALGDTLVEIKHGLPELGVEPGSHRIQKIIYESIFPFWFRDGASQIEAAAQLGWLFLPVSSGITRDDVVKFSSDNDINVISIIDIVKDTHVLIGKKAVI
jgi:hypothetical protein